MDTMMKYVGRIHRYSNLWRSDQLSDQGLNSGEQYYIFLICKRPGVSQEELTRHIMVNKSNVARRLATLESEGFITRQVQSQDKRGYEIYPTDKALAIYPEVVKLMKKWNELLTEDLSEEEKTILLNCLAKMADKAKQLCEKR